MYKNRQKQYCFLVELNLILTVALAAGLYVLSLFITKPIKDLIDSTKVIADGNFSERSKVNSNDEIGILSKNFNIMTDVIQNKVETLEKNSEEKQRFIDNLSHELRTPLTSIIGYADLLRSTKYDEVIFIKGLNHIFNDGKRLEKISTKLMALTQLRGHNIKMKEENIKPILMDVKEVFKFKLEEKNVRLIISGQDIRLKVEKDLIGILINNVIDNALKASGIGSNIYINLNKDDNDNAVISVIDQGIGMSEDNLKKVMEPFYMVDKSRTRANNGAGLGLSICKEIAEIHNAELKIQSQLNKGTCISIVFYQ